MRIAYAIVAAVSLLAAPAYAGGDWNEDVDEDYGAYYVAPEEYYAGFYPPRYVRPRYVAPRYYAGPGYYAPGAYAPYPPYGAYYSGRERFYAGNCEIKRKWRRGRYYEKIDCDD